MGDKYSEGKLSPDIVVAKAIQPYWPWLADLICARKSKLAVAVSGFVGRRDGPTWLVIVRGFNVENFEKVVCFGSGEDLYTAMRNASLAVAKGQWRRDKY